MEKKKISDQIFAIFYPVLLYYVISMLVMAFLGIVLGEDDSFYTIRQTIGAVVSLPFLIRMYRTDVLLSFRTPLEIKKREKVWRYLHAAVCVGLLGVALNNLIGMSGLLQSSSTYQDLSDAFFGTNILIECIGLGIVIPYTEELLYRGLVFGRLKTFLGRKKAIYLSALLFGVVHLNIPQFLYAFAIGIFLAWFADRYQSIWPAFFGHAAANLISILRQEFQIFAFFESSKILYFIWSIALLGIVITLFGVQFKKGTK